MMKTSQVLVFCGIALVSGLIGGWVLWGGEGAQKQIAGEQVNDHGMSHEMNNMVSGISGKTGDEFDTAFLEEMIIHHEGAVAMAEDVLRKSKRAELRKLAEEIILAQTAEIEMMKTWRVNWFK